MKFSIIVVCLNSGEKLNKTLDSILMQSYEDYEIIIKDGYSEDGSVEKRRTDDKIKFYQQKDTGVYDAMNQAVAYAQGEFVIFLKCGDVFYDAHVLEKVAECIALQKTTQNLVIYGDAFEAKNGIRISSAPRINGLTSYRNIPCHRVCFYSIDLCRRKPYDLQYRIRADYDYFLWCYYEAHAKMVHMDQMIASCEDGGFSEQKQNMQCDEQEQKNITRNYMASSKVFGDFYHRVRECLSYRKKQLVIAFVVFLIEVSLLIWPVGWIKKDTINYLSGAGAWMPEVSQQHSGFCQEFVPQHDKLKSMSLLFLASESEGEDKSGSVSIVLSDREGEIVWRTNMDYTSLVIGSYADFDMQLQLKAGATYFLTVVCQNDEGTMVAPALCSKEYPMEENIHLYETDELTDAQLVTKYHYTETMSDETLARALFLCILTALGIGLGLPPRRWIRNVLGVILFIAMPWVLGRRLELLALNTVYSLPFAMNWNILMMYLIQGLLLLLTCSLRWSLVISTAFLTILYSANYFVFAFRGVPLRLNDLYAFGTAVEVANQYNFTPNSHMAMAWCIAGMIVVWAYQCRPAKKFQFSFKVLGLRILCLVMAIGIGGVTGYQLLYTDYLKEQGFVDLHGFDQNMSYHFNGFLVATCLDIQKSRIEEPAGYKVNVVEDILSQAMTTDNASGNDSQELPHVILIMNESFADLRVLGNLEISEENMSFFYGLDENVIRGFTSASVLGGGTANSEFEVFSGCSMGLLPASYYAYQQCVNRPIDTIVSGMNEAGYRTVSIHPAPKGNWNREYVYQYLGFEESYWEEDFTGAEVIHNGVSDLETYKKVQNIFESKKDGERLFIFDLTLQNHGDYEKSNVVPTVTAQNVQSSQVDLFLTLIQNSDSALQHLITYFEGVDEKVVVCIFGDHQPKFSDEEFYRAVRNLNSDVSDQEQMMRQYKTPFLIWANYDIEEAEGLDISMNYLGPLLMKIAKVPMSPYFQFLSKQMEQYPIITVNGYCTTDGQINNWTDEKQEFGEYRMLQHNLLFDPMNTIEWGY